MAHSWVSPARAAREVLRETLEAQLPDLPQRNAVIELAVEEFERQFLDPDDEMLVAGANALDDHLGIRNSLNQYRRRLAVEVIWQAMVAKAFDR